jgi:hypothetical protein
VIGIDQLCGRLLDGEKTAPLCAEFWHLSQDLMNTERSPFEEATAMLNKALAEPA